jgi:glycosyltransferase involved in cell wall biosynthesis
VDDGVTGLVVDRPGDAAAVATALARLLDDPALRSEMGRAARRRAVAELSHDILAERLGKVLARW